MLTIDQLGNQLDVNYPPQRIVSLVPSQTELLFDLGVSRQIVGLTRFCINPANEVKHKTKIGGTKQFDFEKVKQLQPDLIIGNKEENYEVGISQLQKYFPVWMSDVYELEDAYRMMIEIGRITNTESQAFRIVNEIQSGFMPLLLPQVHRKTAAYFIWRKPYMVAAKHTFINEMMKVLGVRNVYLDKYRYPEIHPEELSERRPDFVFLSSEPYSFREIHLNEFRAFSPLSKVVLVDGEMFSWYGSRLKLAAQYFELLRKQLI